MYPWGSEDSQRSVNICSINETLRLAVLMRQQALCLAVAYRCCSLPLPVSSPASAPGEFSAGLWQCLTYQILFCLKSLDGAQFPHFGREDPQQKMGGNGLHVEVLMDMKDRSKTNEGKGLGGLSS